MLRRTFTAGGEARMPNLPYSYSYEPVRTEPMPVNGPRQGVSNGQVRRRLMLWAKVTTTVALLALVSFILTWRIFFSIDIEGLKAFDEVGLRREKTFTVRMNTWRRNDLLKRSVEHFASCDCVGMIQVIWSDQDNHPPPREFFNEHARSKIEYEVHDTNSLNHRFNTTSTVYTTGIFSTDDDLEISCRDLQFAFEAWQSSPFSMVGFSPRMVTRDRKTGRHSYRSWRVVRWNGVYNVILTKCCFLHVDHLTTYMEKVPQKILSYIDTHRNCEDIAMSIVVAKYFGAPPLWVKGTSKEIGSKGISALPHHFGERSRCVDFFADHFDGISLIESSTKIYSVRTGLLSWL